jgi:hypothetical protein
MLLDKRKPGQALALTSYTTFALIAGLAKAQGWKLNANSCTYKFKLSFVQLLLLSNLQYTFYLLKTSKLRK